MSGHVLEDFLGQSAVAPVAVVAGEATSETCDEERPVNPVFPGSSPWVTSLGATFVVDDPKIKRTYETPLCKENTCCLSNDL